MSYKLQKPYTEVERLNFIAEYSQDCNGKRGYAMAIEETETALYALEPNEIMQNGDVIINPNYQAQQAHEEKQLRIVQIKQELVELDTKRIRAMCEPSLRDDGQDWLCFYNQQAQCLRTELQELEERAKNDYNINK